MALTVELNIDNYNQFFNKCNNYLNQVDKIKSGISKNFVKQCLNDLFNCVKSGVNENDLISVTPTLNATQNIESNVNTLESNDNSNLTQDSETANEPTLEIRFDKLEKMVEKLIESQNNRPNHYRNVNQRPNRRTMNGSGRTDNRRCWTCGRTGHISRNCYSNCHNHNSNQRQRPRSFQRTSYQNQNTNESHFLWPTLPTNTNPHILVGAQHQYPPYSTAQHTTAFQPILTQSQQLVRN